MINATTSVDSKLNINKNVKIDRPDITLKDFVINYVDHNSLIRIWKESNNSVKYLLRKKVLHGHEIYNSPYQDMLFSKVFGVFDSDLEYNDCINILIHYEQPKFKTNDFMNIQGLNFWKVIDTYLNSLGFQLTHTIDDYKHCYYKDGFDGWVECDIDNQTVEVMKYTDSTPFTFVLENMEHVDLTWLTKNI